MASSCFFAQLVAHSLAVSPFPIEVYSNLITTYHEFCTFFTFLLFYRFFYLCCVVLYLLFHSLHGIPCPFFPTFVMLFQMIQPIKAQIFSVISHTFQFISLHAIVFHILFYIVSILLFAYLLDHSTSFFFSFFFNALTMIIVLMLQPFHHRLLYIFAVLFSLSSCSLSLFCFFSCSISYNQSIPSLLPHLQCVQYLCLSREARIKAQYTTRGLPGPDCYTLQNLLY